MTNILIVAELAEGKVKKSTHSSITFARSVGAPFSILVIGEGAKAAAADVAAFGAAKILVCDDAYLVGPVCERFAPTIAEVRSLAVDAMTRAVNVDALMP